MGGRLMFVINERALRPAADKTTEFAREELGEPLRTLTLHAGDLLYLPRGVVHQALAQASGHSLHLTFSTYQRHTWRELLVADDGLTLSRRARSLSSTGLTPHALRGQVRFLMRLSAVLLPELGAARRAAHLFSYLLVHTRIDQDARRGIGLDGRRVGRASMDAADEGAARRLGDAGTAPHRPTTRVATADGGRSCAGGREPASSSRCDAAAAALPAAAVPAPGPGPGREHAQRRPQVAGGDSSSASERSGGRGRKGRYLLKPAGAREESFSRARRYSRDSAASRAN